MAQKIRSAEGILRVIPPPGAPAILPKSGEPNILITSALPYCNNVPHLGNIIGSTLSADVFSRYSRTRNRTTLYICGTDEYGTATETQALKEGITPRELCDKYHLVHKATYEWFDIGFDHFGRTSTPLHTEISQEIYTNLGKHDLLERQDKAQTYCEGCPKFLADRFVEGICPHCGYEDARGDQCDNCTRTLDAVELIKPRCLVDKTHTVTTRTSAHMYYRLNAVQDRTIEWIKSSSKAGKWSSNSVINSDGEIIDARLNAGLYPTPLTRDLKWGVPVPVEEGDEFGMAGKVLYVWFDAPIGYPSITANYTPEWKKWWFNPKDVKLYQFMGKDNVYFHTVYWPAVQIGDGRDWTLLHHVNSTEYLNYEGGKFSKSRGRGVFGPAATETGIPASVWRYYLLSARPENADSTFSWAECIAANNNVLLNNFGNFVNRTLKFISSQYNGVLPDGGDAPGPLAVDDALDGKFIQEVNDLLKVYIDAMEAVKLRLGLQTIMHISGAGNTYLQSSGLNKALMTENPVRCGQVLSRAVNLIYVLSTLIYPFMPATSDAILAQINAPARAVPDVLSTDILAGHTIGKPEHLFKKIEENMAETFRLKFGGNEPQPQAAAADPLQAAPPLSKRQAAAAAKKAAAAKVDAGPKSPEYLALEAKIQEQGQTVRTLKGQVPKTSEVDAQIAAAVETLKGLKLELEGLGRS
ncbi:tRNA synthetases class I (M)-domain-containing protein [Mycena albidolilacea]|uniref:methionine--tRNA ligase n=1 Tax=Mycena albidolilacea TaxID=1033008 RepID=A0AAD7AP04_9AGAR|nr:tRNA synthetases class I (M)-domain-containing protein [Mycena albidolilacea]